MIELNRISVKEYLELENKDQYNWSMKFAKQFTDSIDCLNVGDIIQKPFGLIKDFQYHLENGMDFMKQLELMQQLTENKNIIKTDLQDYCRSCVYVIDSIKGLIEVENKTLSHTSSFEEEHAGIGLFNGLGIYMQIRKLAGNDITKINQVRQLPYCDCFTELLVLKQEHEFQKRINEIYKNKK